MEEKIIAAGFGGQGVMALGQILTYAGMLEGKEVCWVPSFGPEMRGGTANCNVIISSEEIGAPIIEFSNTAIVLNEASFDKFEDKVLPGGLLIVNSSMTDRTTDRTDITTFYVPANDIAHDEIGNERTVNMIMMGAYIAATGAVHGETVVKPESLEESFVNVFGEKRAKLWPMNEKAIKAGMDAVEAQK